MTKISPCQITRRSEMKYYVSFCQPHKNWHILNLIFCQNWQKHYFSTSCQKFNTLFTQILIYSFRPLGENHSQLSRFFWERPMTGDTVTKHSFLSLPSIQAGSSLYTHFVKNLTVSQGEMIRFSPTTDQNHECQKQFLGDRALHISQVCPLKEIKIAAVSQSLRWGKGQIFLIHSKKDAVIHLTCAYTVTLSLKLGMDFSLFLIHDACAVTVVYGNQGSRFSRPAIETNEALQYTFFHILQYDLITSQTKS